jgi:uncharacterized protein (DUF1684 family)
MPLLMLSRVSFLALLLGPAAVRAAPRITKVESAKVSEHEKEILAWRQQRVSKLKSDEGWLVLAGLFFLEEGANRFGSAADDPVALPAHSAPGHAGVLELHAGKVTIAPAPGTTLTIAGKAIGKQELRSDTPGPADVVALGDLRFFIIERDGRLAVRLRDLRNPRRSHFPGIDYFPIRPEYRIDARFVPHPGGATPTIKITNVLGKLSDMKSPGKLLFELDGQRLSLDAVQDEPTDTRLFILFRDQTAGKETYGAGRFLYSEGLPKDGHVILDFNKAYNPPCALTPFATCPLPPPQNRLPLRIEAGEKNFAGGHD